MFKAYVLLLHRKLFSKNTNASIEKTKKNIKEILKIAIKNNLKIRAYMSCVLGCPYEGKVSYKKLLVWLIFFFN